MPWPTQVWDPQHDDADEMGMVPFAAPMEPGEAYLRRKGLSLKVYEKHIWQAKSHKVTVWDAMESPFFKAMYELKDGRNWDNLKKAFDEEIGTYEDQDFRIQTGTRQLTEREQIRGLGQYRNQSTEEVTKEEPIYQTFSGYQAAVDWVNSNPEDEWGNEYELSVDDIELAAQPPSDADDDYRFWGIDDEDWISLFNEMADQGARIQKRFDLQEAPIIREGPKASDYGINAHKDNIFTYYGLDKPHTGPVVLGSDESGVDWTGYQWNLKPTWTSNVTYAIPPGLRRVNLHQEEDGWQPRASIRDRIPQPPAQQEPWRQDQVAEATGEPIT